MHVHQFKCYFKGLCVFNDAFILTISASSYRITKFCYKYLLLCKHSLMKQPLNTGNCTIRVFLCNHCFYTKLTAI